MLPDDFLDWILTELNNIPHVEVVRIGSRTPVVLPYRITDELVANAQKTPSPLAKHTLQSPTRINALSKRSPQKTRRLQAYH